jgi:hypothetical protein
VPLTKPPPPLDPGTTRWSREEREVERLKMTLTRGSHTSLIAEREKGLLTQKVHIAPNTQQAEQAGFTRAKSHETCQSIFPEN